MGFDIYSLEFFIYISNLTAGWNFGGKSKSNGAFQTLMKHIFIVNPAAGVKNPYDTVKAALDGCSEKPDFEIYQTLRPLDATRYVRETCERISSPLRFYACGGDGTLNEVVNGVVGHPHAEVALFPCGSGDDFAKYYGGSKSFLNISDSVNGKPADIDLLKIDGRYAINVISFGFDSIVAETIDKVKRKPVIGGRNSYATGIIRALFSGMRNKCSLTVDGEGIGGKTMLLCTLSNGTHVGGSFKCAPNSKNDDGLIEVCLVKPVSLFTFIALIGEYKKGRHLSDKRFEKYLYYRRGKFIHCRADDKSFSVSVDGEVVHTNNFTVEIVPAAIKFVIPKGVITHKE